MNETDDEVVAHIQNRLDTACFGSGDRRSVEALLTHYARLKAVYTMLKAQAERGAPKV